MTENTLKRVWRKHTSSKRFLKNVKDIKYLAKITTTQAGDGHFFMKMTYRGLPEEQPSPVSANVFIFAFFRQICFFNSFLS